MKATNPDPSLELASRIYAFREDGESWTDAVDGFARSVLMRHPRTVHRWLAGESPIPKAVAAWIMDGTPRTAPYPGGLQDWLAADPATLNRAYEDDNTEKAGRRRGYYEEN